MRYAFAVALALLTLSTAASAHHRRWHHPHHHHHHYQEPKPSNPGAIIGGIIGGFIGSLSQEDAIEHCIRKYRSYNPETGFYLGFDGRYRRCP